MPFVDFNKLSEEELRRELAKIREERRGTGKKKRVQSREKREGAARKKKKDDRPVIEL